MGGAWPNQHPDVGGAWPCQHPDVGGAWPSQHPYVGEAWPCQHPDVGGACTSGALVSNDRRLADGWRDDEDVSTSFC